MDKRLRRSVSTAFYATEQADLLEQVFAQEYTDPSRKFKFYT